MRLRKENILVVDDDFDMLELVKRNLSLLNYHTYKASSAIEAIDILKNSTIDLVITDLQMPGINGLELIKYVQDHFPEIPKLVITGYPTFEGAVASVKSGAIDYLVKPFTTDEFKKAIYDSFESRKISLEPISSERNSISKITHYAGMIGKSATFDHLIDIIERVKNNRATILIEGESGTGKELIARAIHYKGSFASGAFITVNCGAIPENLLESELFGHIKGAFTGATEQREGLFQAANGGTIFLDEIGNASLSVQVKLLRVLQEKEVTMIGSTKSQKVNLRIIAATNGNLMAMISKGTFREDLYYRLNVVNIETVPLRERKNEILPLIDLFIKKYGQEYNNTEVQISTDALDLLTRYSYPGNVRELENLIQRLIILSNKVIEVKNIPNYLKHTMLSKEETLVSLREMEKAYILKVLAKVNGNKTKAAEILGIDRKTLRMKLN